MYRNQVDVRPLPCQVVEPTLEWPDLLAGAAGALRKDDQRIPRIQRLDQLVHLRSQLAEVATLAVDQHGSEYPCRRVPTEWPGLPIVLGGDRPGALTQVFGQHRPKHDEVEMAGVVGKEDALTPTRTIIGGADACAAGKSRQCRHTCGDDPCHAVSKSATIRRSRLRIVTIPPAMMRISAATSTRPSCQPTAVSTAESRQAAISTCIRRGLAIGPTKCCDAPAAAPRVRT